MRFESDCLLPDWDVPARVQALVTTRAGGHSEGPWGGAQGRDGMNLGLGTDLPTAVVRNRAKLRTLVPQTPRWLRQVHGNDVIDAAEVGDVPPAADASFTTQSGIVCAVLVADCLPVLLADTAGRGVAVAHAGWRGLAAGVLQNTVRSLRSAIRDPDARVLAYFGPAIGPECFEVGGEVLEAMRMHLPDAGAAFASKDRGKFHANLFELARQALRQVNVRDTWGGKLCTVCDAARFYSFRRDGTTGRHAALVWLQP